MSTQQGFSLYPFPSSHFRGRRTKQLASTLLSNTGALFISETFQHHLAHTPSNRPESQQQKSSTFKHLSFINTFLCSPHLGMVVAPEVMPSVILCCRHLTLSVGQYLVNNTLNEVFFVKIDTSSLFPNLVLPDVMLTVYPNAVSVCIQSPHALTLQILLMNTYLSIVPGTFAYWA